MKTESKFSNVLWHLYISAENVHSIRAIMAPEDALYSLCIKPSFYFPLPNRMYSHSHKRIMKPFDIANPQRNTVNNTPSLAHP